VTVNGGTPFTITTTGTSYTYTGNYGDVVSIVVKATNPDSSAQSGTSSSSTVTLLSPNGDSDGDGMKNSAEDIAGTNPFNPASVFRVTAVTSTSVTWSSVVGRTYQLTSATSPGGPFNTLVGNPITATGATTSESITAASGTFYRVEIAP
jgi:thrombospondin type 3 repeat protein